MDIRCERCRAEYEFDESRIPDTGVTVKCTTCGHVFKVKRPVAAAAPAGDISLRRGGQIIATGCPDMATLQRWIVERRVLGEDEWQQGGMSWRVVAQTQELMPFLGLIAAAERASQPAIQPVRIPHPDESAATQQMMPRVFGQQSMAPDPANAGATLHFRAPQIPQQPQQALPDPGQAGSTMQFRAPSAMPVAAPAPAQPQHTMQFQAPVGYAAPAYPDPAQAGSTMQFRPPPTAGYQPPQPAFAPPPDDSAATMTFRLPSMPTAGSFEAPSPLQASVANAASTMQFRAPSLPPAVGHFGAPVEVPPPPAPPEPAATMQFRVPTTGPTPAGITTSMPVPAQNPSLTPTTLPPTVKPQPAEGAGPLAFRVPQSTRAPDLGATPAMSYAAPDNLQPKATTEFRAPEPPAPPPPPKRPESRIPESVRTIVEEDRPLPKPAAGSRDDDDSTRRTKPANDEDPTRRMRSEPAWTKGGAPTADEDEEDPEITAFRKASRTSPMVYVAAVAVVVLAVVGYFVIWPQFAKRGAPSKEALGEFEKGRRAYLTDAVVDFKESEAAYRKAIELAEPAEFTKAHAALGELHAAWAERLYDDAAQLAKRITAESAAGRADQAKSLAKGLEQANAEAKSHLETAFAEANTAFAADPEDAWANRALVDYYRVAKDPQTEKYAGPVQRAAEADPEMKAHLGGAWLRDPSRAAAGENALKEALKSMGTFARGHVWLADYYLTKDNQEAFLAEMTALAAASPNHERARAVLAEAKAAEEAKKKAEAEAAAAVDGGTADAGEAAPAPKAEAPSEPKPKPEPKAEAPAEPKTVDVDKLIEQASKWLDKGKDAKALALYDQALAVSPKNIDGLYGKGLCQFDLGKTDDAIETFQTALSINPKFADAMIAIAEAYKAKSQNGDAVKWYKKYLVVQPDGEQASVAKTNIERLQ